ncbi:unnamed protein product [Strongylus vulgaris]|uniref:Tr-type G domain-containing protein n=1 Tax=Strongylus vulgaris TaxID=40348 RepID=A0A3P7JDK2_STRVU|nr:unnamed protein product [Strongylus vulgaris]
MLCFLDSDDDEANVKDGGLDALFLVRNKPEEIEKYVIHLRKMLLEGEGETVVEIGVPIEQGGKASGIPTKDLETAVANHVKALASIPAIGTKIETRTNGDKSTEVWIVRDPPLSDDFIEVRVAVVGNVDAGKSTLLGVLTHSVLDDGRGLARTKLFRHKHEFESGRTSSVGNDILGFDVHGNVVNKPDKHNNNLDWVQISRDCSKVTKIDMCPPQILQETMKNIGRLVKSEDFVGAGARKLPVMVRNTNDVIHAAVNFPICPIFQVSNVEGTNLDLLRQFLNIVPLRRTLCENDPAHFQVRSSIFLAKLIQFLRSFPCILLQIDDVYWVEGVGTILILHHPTTIKPNYQAMLHIGSIRQTATLVSMTKEVLRTGDRDRVTFRFIRLPEYIRPGTRMVFREGRTKAVGTVVNVIPQSSLAQQRANKLKDKTNRTFIKRGGPKPPNGKPSKVEAKE